MDKLEQYMKNILKCGSFESSGRRNEALDIRVYALCAADVYLDQLVLEYKGMAKLQKIKASEILKINHNFVLDILKKETGNMEFYSR